MITNLNIGYNGRFGNQLFQFAALIGISDKINTTVKIPYSNTINIKNQTTMDGKTINAKFELNDCFNIDEYIVDDDYIKIYNQANESHFHFDPNLFNINDYTSINGYFQSHKYFQHIDLSEILSFKDDILIKAKELLPNNSKELVSIHIRRGDYLTPNIYHPVVSDDYINKSINYFDSDKYHFVVFSDDLEWCNDRWGSNDKFDIISSGSHFIDFCTMSLCEHHIISNSSFSWWSSYLSKYDKKITLAPHKWFGPGYSNYITSDLYRDDMIIIH